MGRQSLLDGHPMLVSEIMAAFPGVAFIERCTVSSPAAVNRTKKALKRAFTAQLERRGFSMVEILSMCPTNWKMTPADSCRWIDGTMSQVFKPGVMKDWR
jgi:2-oxoglutarate ferredoxin oxidoreductase subunit beta